MAICLQHRRAILETILETNMIYSISLIMLVAALVSTIITMVVQDWMRAKIETGRNYVEMVQYVMHMDVISIIQSFRSNVEMEMIVLTRKGHACFSMNQKTSNAGWIPAVR